MDISVDPKALGERIKTVRGARSQADLASSVGIRQNYIARYEKGVMPSPNILLRISYALDVTIEWLLTGEGSMRRGGGEAPQAGGSPIVGSELSEEGRRLLQLYFRLPVDVRREFIGGIRFVLGREKDKDLDREIAELLDVIEKAG